MNSSPDIKKCLNCEADVNGKYCHQCGQENIQLKHGFFEMLRHFIYDIFHFDGKFFHTLKYLITRPGKVAKQYAEGKRARYLDPIRMYLFVSAITFLLFPMFTNVEQSLQHVHLIATPVQRLKEANRHYHLIKASNNKNYDSILQILLDTSVYLRIRNIGDSNTDSLTFPFLIGKNEYTAKPLTDSVLFPEDSWFNRRVSKKMRKKFYEEGEDINKLISVQNNVQLQLMPYLFFLSLPIFAWILQLVFRRKQYHYSYHAVFTLYHYIAVFLLLLFSLLVSLLFRLLSFNPRIFYILMLLTGLYYLMAELKFFYQENWLKTVYKFFILLISSVLSLAIIFLIFIYFLYVL